MKRRSLKKRLNISAFSVVFFCLLTLYCVISVLSGILREGILFWAPLLLARILAGLSTSVVLRHWVRTSLHLPCRRRGVPPVD